MTHMAQDHGKILVVDDEKNFRIVLARLLGSVGYQVSVADGPETALGILRQQMVSLIVTDLRMANMDGLCFCQQVRAEIGQIPSIVFTADATRIDPAVQRRAGVVGFLEKPFDNQDVLNLIARVLRGTAEAAHAPASDAAEQQTPPINFSVWPKEPELS